MDELTLKVEKFGVKIPNYGAELRRKRNLDEDSLRKIFDLLILMGRKAKKTSLYYVNDLMLRRMYLRLVINDNSHRPQNGIYGGHPVYTFIQFKHSHQ